MALTKCGDSSACEWNPFGGCSSRWLNQRSCDCDCAVLTSYSDALRLTCREMCDNDQSAGGNAKKDPMAFICNVIGAQAAFDRHGLVCPGFDIMTQTGQGQAYSQQAADKLALTKAASAGNILVYGIAGIAVLGIIFFLLRK